MEPANLNDRTPEDDRLAALLRPSSPEIADDGFTGRVLAALSPSAAVRPYRTHWFAYIAGGLVGLIVLLWQSDGGRDLVAAARPFAGALGQLATVGIDPWISAALGLTILSLGIAYLAYRPRWRLV